MATDNNLSGVYKPEFAAAILIGITGTNGKSTVTTLVDLMLKKSGFRTVLGGNIGNALTEEIYKVIVENEKRLNNLEVDRIVAEISSFQLETISEFRPKVAMILNITADHLDRYDGMDDYVDTKARIFENQGPGDFLILNGDDPVLTKMRAEKLEGSGDDLPKVLLFSRKNEVQGIYCKDGMIYCSIPNLPWDCPSPFINMDEIKIKGLHNLENAMAASLGALISGAAPGAVVDVLKEFGGLEHRLEDAGEINGVRFINDSKGTNIGAVARSLEGLEKVILIMGGTDKDSDFGSLRNIVKEKVKLLIVLGETKGKISSALGEVVKTEEVSDLREAVGLAHQSSTSGDVVLLSPGCASFDMFRDFEDRGNKFKEAVRQLQITSQG